MYIPAACKLRAAELRDEALFKDPPAKEDCPICFLPMPTLLMSCITLPPATISSVPVNDFAKASAELAKMDTEVYYQCCGKSICSGCTYNFNQSGNNKCPFCNSDRSDKSDEEMAGELMKRVAANDADSICVLAGNYHDGRRGFLQDHTKAMELYARAADLGSSRAHSDLANVYRDRGDMKKAKFHVEAAAMLGNEAARLNLGGLEAQSGNKEQAVKHWKIAASAGYYHAMQFLRLYFEQGHVSRESIDSTLIAYNNSCVEMRSEARDAFIHEWMQ